jgi:hypothetical protein
MSINAIRALVLFLFFPGLCFNASAQFTQRQVDGYRRSVVQVQASGCSAVPGGLQVGSGFLWKQSTWVVTALHVVNGCAGLSVHSDVASDSAPAHITKLLYADDLVLLNLDKVIAGTSFFSKAKDAPQDTEDLLVVGFPEDTSGSVGKTVRRQFSGDTLKTIASYAAQEELGTSKSPSLDIAVIFLQGILEHGHSGGPILNSAGDVVAVADGGLKHGTTEDSWAIPSYNLAALETSPEPLTKMTGQRSSLLFAATPGSSAEPAIQCGGGNFRHLKTVSYPEVVLTADDVRGLQQLVVASGINPTNFSFEVYQDLQTGASVVLPAGEILVAGAGTCVATSLGGSVTTRVRMADASSDMTGTAAALQFEFQVMGIGPGWIIAQAFSYLQPLPVVGGGISLRKDWVHYVPFPGTGQLNFEQFDAQQFETLALRGKSLLGVVAQNNRWNPTVAQTQQACRANANISSFCPQALQDSSEWIESVLAVHLSTLAGT